MHIRHRFGRAVATALLTILAACSDSAAVNPSATVAPNVAPATARVASAGILRPQEDDFVTIAASVPSFSGYYYDRGDLVIALTDTTQGSRASAIIQKLGTGNEGSTHPQGSRTGRTRYVEAKYTFAELKAWRDLLFDPLMEMDSVEYLDLDEYENKVVVAVNQPAAVAGVEAVARSNNVPVDAVVTEISDPMRSTSTLQERQRPVQGGLRIESEVIDASTGQFKRCSAGYTSRNFGRLGVLIPSHCTKDFWAADGTSFFQSTGTEPADFIGVEVSDPPPFPCGFRNHKRCRYSDAAFVETATNVVQFARIARTTFFSVGTQSPGSIIIDAHNPDWRVTSRTGAVHRGDVLDKVGESTGWTTGEVKRTCVDHKDPTGGGRRILCQDHLETRVDFGDSGGPVFVFRGRDAQAHGLVKGIILLGNYMRLVLSPLTGVTIDLGSVGVS